MKVLESWTEKITDENTSIHDLCFRPDGTQLVVAAGNKVLVFDPLDGTLIKALAGHKETVYCLSYAKDGSYFASGGADKMVIIWTSELEGTLRFQHNEAIQALAFNPITSVLITCAITDFGLWSSKEKFVPKTKVNSRITSCAWTSDGLFMALGFFNGTVQIRDKNGEEKLKIERPDAANTPVWCVEWTKTKNSGEILAVADWSQKLSFYHLTGKQAFKDKKIGFDAAQISWHSDGEYLVTSGSNKQCNIYTSEGVKLHTVCEKESWVLCAKQKPGSNFLAVGSQDGTITMFQLAISTVHGLYKEKYAFRESMTDVIIHNLITEVKVRIKCKDFVKKLAVYKDSLAVQLPDKVVIYEIDSNDPKSMTYKGKKSISKKFDCNLFVITSENIILCYEKRLECLNLKGEKIKEWQMEYSVRYLKVIGGPVGKEGILVGLRSGHVFQIFVDSAFPVQLIKQSNSIRYVDMSMQRQKLAVIDDNLTLFVYNLKNGDLIFQEPNANSVAWNSSCEDMLAFSGGGNVSIIVSNFPPQKQRLQGVVVGFNGSYIFYTNALSVSSIEIAHSNSMSQYLEKKMFKEAYDVACLGVTHRDWETLGLSALENLHLEIARKSFIRVKDFKYLNLIYNLQEMKKQGGLKNDVILAFFNAYQSKFTEAAKAFRKGGEENLAMQMFTDLRMFDMAKEYISGADMDKNSILMKQAEWALRNGDVKTAAEMYMNARQYGKAIDLAGKNNWSEMLLEIVRKLDKADRDSLNKCAEYFKKMKLHNFAGEVYEKMGNIKELIELRMASNQWDEVFALAKKYPDLNNMAHYKYGQWLAENDKFEEAQKAFNEAGFKKEAIKVLEELTFNAVIENRFNDASYYYWLLSMEYLQIASDEPNDQVREKSLKKFNEFQRLAEIYCAYEYIHKSVLQPYDEFFSDVLFNSARFLIHELNSEQQQIPIGISKFKILYTAAKISKELDCFKFSRNILERMDEVIVPHKFSDEVEQMSMSIKAKPFKDKDDYIPLCYRCSQHNSLLNSKGNNCSNCLQPYVISFASFDPLPLVEFILPDDISDEEALSLIDYVPNSQFDKDAEKRQREAMYGDLNTARGSTNRLVIGDQKITSSLANDPFVGLMKKYNANANEYKPIIVNREVLKAIDPTHVFVSKWPSPLRWKFYKIILTSEPIIKCNFCNRFFHTDDFELSLLKKGQCPFCRRSKNNSNN
ncbi:unnamed protein product [Brachionus calyciflorus]|uniref:Intraflagellar transport protein 122 homolog n=1 Tax=Brachionus calyciflorus TaxID=104777 RepID=A0A813SIC2_9BILA|nr:unnamed protein product [Brachionus calyciflorus]